MESPHRFGFGLALLHLAYYALAALVLVPRIAGFLGCSNSERMLCQSLDHVFSFIFSKLDCERPGGGRDQLNHTRLVQALRRLAVHLVHNATLHHALRLCRQAGIDTCNFDLTVAVLEAESERARGEGGEEVVGAWRWLLGFDRVSWCRGRSYVAAKTGRDRSRSRG